ncbi:MAG: hypothetical protein JOZ31_27315 [Verrucomicrobia bacterium]|nr:hypothetical protein [Verrucomicrobiota bacterium]
MEKIREFAQANQPFRIHLADTRVLEIKGRDWISTHPSGQGTIVTVYGPGDDEEHWVPIRAITNVSVGEANSQGT